MAKSSKAKKGNTQSKAKKAAVKTTVNDTTSKEDAAEVKEAPAAKTEVKETVAAKAAEVKEAAAKEVKEVAEKVKETTAKVKEEVKETTAKAKEEVKKQVEKKTAAKKEEAPKTRGRKPAAAKTDTAKTAKKPAAKTEAKTTTKKTAKFEPEVIVQYQGNEAEQAEIIERIKAQFVSEGHRAGNIKSLKVYIKPEDGAVYYVINDKNAGKVNLF